jgi:pyruvate-formate lyase
MKQTNSACGQAAPELQSCVCTKNNNIAAISSAISSSVSYSCGSTASDDQASAMAVFSQYCNPSTTINLPTPTANIVSNYITDIAAYSYLAPCARTGVSYGVMGLV